MHSATNMPRSDTENVIPFVDSLVLSTNKRADHLLQLLVEIQQQYSYVPGKAILRLANQLGLPASEIRGVIAFYSFLYPVPQGDYQIHFSDNIIDRMSGSEALIQNLRKRLGVSLAEPRADGRVTVSTTSCIGMADHAPAALVNGYPLTKLDPQRIDRIAELVDNSVPVTEWPSNLFHVSSNVHRCDLLLSDSFESGSALSQLFETGAQKLLEELTISGLRGRGGAGFQTAQKWKMCRDTDASERYVICNADEGEPGSFKDRFLLETNADALIEGITLCGLITGAQKGLIYLRSEYRYLKQHLEESLTRRRTEGLLGKSILAHDGADFDIEIHLGAGAYICGEESALIESLEGKRGIPRNRPPYPISEGYLGKPSVVNNVATFFVASWIATRGGDWFATRGTTESIGTKLFSISGDCQHPGIYEFPFGLTIRELLDACGATETRAVQVTGPAGNLVLEDSFDRRLCYEDLPAGGSFMIFNKSRSLLDVVQYFSDFFAHESCGFCTPCRVGTSLIRDLVNKAHHGNATRQDYEQLDIIAEVMNSSSRCGLGHTASRPIMQAMQKAPDLFTHQGEKR
ncbi:NADP oxidoreductase [Solemya velum gill symbiont]|uniref:NADH-quinone oxidoreductase subunit F n=2 Tax=Solemya velum gill symbiont TaxID=2340 RepID=A0A1T2D8G3_SOVGS|nr:NADP oxidoreductase [Solemya velum gill symbiont]OOY37826.1 NADP oxidoreductase [Solemya velum gill symbiont]OOY41121.1 NADP oxidoreductase [Solemya velum gill symbiont]OOY43347.1 NADP oxidoreductase [Solemya velum gill symbiont]OOY46931.1 NADP oxidoreductase [Solemya velum gill symbiont]